MEISPNTVTWYYRRNFLVIHPVSSIMRIIYVTFCLILAFGIIIAFFLSSYYKFVMLFIIAGVLVQYWQKLIPPGNFFPVRISTEGLWVKINRKRYLKEDLIFLGFREDEGCRRIRLEGKRNRFMLPNEVELKADCNDFEEALNLCRAVRDFIKPDLIINYIRIGSECGCKI